MFNKKCDVLIVGAGPVGLFAALRLAQGGRSVRVIDRAPHGNVDSYALALHGATLDLMNQAGLLNEVMEGGLPLTRVAFSEGGSPIATLDLYELGGTHPFCQVIPQSTLEEVLKRALQARGIKVEWNRELLEVSEVDQGLEATVATLAESPQGYGVSDFARVVSSEERVSAEYMVAADGMDSTVRRLLNIPLRHHGKRRYFMVFEFEDSESCGGALHVDFTGDLVNVFWPMAAGRGRWTFEVEGAQARNPHPPAEEAFALLRERVPWFKPQRPQPRWVATVGFSPAVAEPFGSGPVWLAGDAAHTTMPFGVQGLNAGLMEADLLADCMVLSPPSMTRHDMLGYYNESRHREWLRLMEPPGATMLPVLQSRALDVMAAIPATGDTLERALRMLRPITANV